METCCINKQRNSDTLARQSDILFIIVNIIVNIMINNYLMSIDSFYRWTTVVW